MSPRHRVFVAAVLSALSVPSDAQTEGLPPRALLRVHASFNQGGHGFTVKDQDLFASTDRSVAAVLVTNIFHNPTFGPRWLTSHVDRPAPRAAYSALVQALGDNRIGAQAGDCSVRVTVVPSFGRYEISWYGRGVRRRDLMLELNGASQPCPAELSRIVNAINLFAHQSGVDNFGLPVVP